jgi:phosphoglycolate phosphatase
MFDHDGVIVDSFEVFSGALMEGAAAAGFDALAAPDDVLDLFEGNVYEALRAAGADDAQIRSAVGWALTTLHKAAPWLRPFPLMPEVLNELAEARHVVIVSSNSAEVIEGFLRRHAIVGVAEIAGAEAGQSKVTKIEELRGRFPQQEACWFVGDTAGDMREARAAGVLPLGVAWGWHDPERLRAAGAERIAADPADLLAIVAPDLRSDFLGLA